MRAADTDLRAGWPGDMAAAPATDGPPQRDPNQPADPAIPFNRQISSVPASVFGLEPAEQLLIWSARRWRHGRYRWAEVEGEFRRHLGAAWSDALLPWDMALDLLHRMPLGQPDIRNGCETALSGDEMALLRLTGLMQRGPVADTGLLMARLARRQDREELAEWIGLVAGALPRLPVRSPRPDSGTGMLRAIPPDR